MNADAKNYSPLERFYLTVNSEAQRHFREVWQNHFKRSEKHFYKRLKRPIIEDLALFQFVFKSLILKDAIVKAYNFENKGIKIYEFDTTDEPLFV